MPSGRRTTSQISIFPNQYINSRMPNLAMHTSSIEIERLSNFRLVTQRVIWNSRLSAHAADTGATLCIYPLR